MMTETGALRQLSESAEKTKQESRRFLWVREKSDRGSASPLPYPPGDPAEGSG